MTTECRNILRTVRLQKLDDLKMLVESAVHCVSQQNSKKEVIFFTFIFLFILNILFEWFLSRHFRLPFLSEMSRYSTI